MIKSSDSYSNCPIRQFNITSANALRIERSEDLPKSDQSVNLQRLIGNATSMSIHDNKNFFKKSDEALGEIEGFLCVGNFVFLRERLVV